MPRPKRIEPEVPVSEAVIGENREGPVVPVDAPVPKKPAFISIATNPGSIERVAGKAWGFSIPGRFSAEEMNFSGDVGYKNALGIRMQSAVNRAIGAFVKGDMPRPECPPFKETNTIRVTIELVPGE